MLISTLLFAGLGAIANVLQARAFNVPADCLAVCPAQAIEIGTACLAFTGGDNSQEDGCQQGCHANTKNTMQACRDCIWGVDQPLGRELQRGHTVVCLGGSLSSTTAAATTTSATKAVSSVSTSSNTTAAAPTSPAANVTQVENGAFHMAPAQAAVFLGLVVAML